MKKIFLLFTSILIILTGSSCFVDESDPDASIRICNETDQTIYRVYIENELIFPELWLFDSKCTGYKDVDPQDAWFGVSWRDSGSSFNLCTADGRIKGGYSYTITLRNSMTAEVDED